MLTQLQHLLTLNLHKPPDTCSANIIMRNQTDVLIVVEPIIFVLELMSCQDAFPCRPAQESSRSQSPVPTEFGSHTCCLKRTHEFINAFIHAVR